MEGENSTLYERRKFYLTWKEKILPYMKGENSTLYERRKFYFI